MKISMTNEQRLFLLRELVSIRKGLSEEIGVKGASVEGRLAVAGELSLVHDVIRKLEHRLPYGEGKHY